MSLCQFLDLFGRSAADRGRFLDRFGNRLGFDLDRSVLRCGAQPLVCRLMMRDLGSVSRPLIRGGVVSLVALAMFCGKIGLVVRLRGLAGIAVVAVLVLVMGGALLGQHRLAIADRDPVIIRMDFAEGEEAVAVAAIFDEGCL